MNMILNFLYMLFFFIIEYKLLVIVNLYISNQIQPNFQSVRKRSNLQMKMIYERCIFIFIHIYIYLCLISSLCRTLEKYDDGNYPGNDSK